MTPPPRPAYCALTSSHVPDPCSYHASLSMYQVDKLPSRLRFSTTFHSVFKYICSKYAPLYCHTHYESLPHTGPRAKVISRVFRTGIGSLMCIVPGPSPWPVTEAVLVCSCWWTPTVAAHHGKIPYSISNLIQKPSFFLFNIQLSQKLTTELGIS